LILPLPVEAFAAQARCGMHAGGTVLATISATRQHGFRVLCDRGSWMPWACESAGVPLEAGPPSAARRYGGTTSRCRLRLPARR